MPHTAQSPPTNASTPLTFQEQLHAVHIRKSVRNFVEVPLKKADADAIFAYLADDAKMTGPLSGSCRLVLLNHLGTEAPQVSTYGYTKNAQAMLVGVSRNTPLDLLELAYVFHGLVLELTHREVGSVWIGGAVKRADVLKSLSIDEGEIIGAIAPLGYPSDKKRIFDRIAGAVMSGRKPLARVAFLGDFTTPLDDEGMGGPFHEALDIARRAPSAKNKQSWRSVVDVARSRVHFYVEFSLKGQVGTGFRQYACPPEYLDLGTYLKSFEVAMAAQGRFGMLEVADPGLEMPAKTDTEYVATWVLT